MGLFDFLKKKKTDDAAAPVEEVSAEVPAEPVVEAAPEMPAAPVEEAPVEEVPTDPVAM